jgi:ribosomal protein L16/L10AE
VDGKDQPEFTRSGGAKPVFHMSTKVVDPYTKEMTEVRVGDPKGTRNVIIFGVSKDSKVMTMTYKDEHGTITDTAIYDRVW